MTDNQKKPSVPKADQKEALVQEDQLPKDQANIDGQLAEMQTLLQKARESEIRAMADYQNLVRRTQEDRLKLVKFAALSAIEGLLEPLDHLFLAKEQLKDPGLNMVYQQFVQALQAEGLEEIEVLAKEFDPATMEVVATEEVADQKQDQKVIKVAQRGYRLHGDVIRHAKVTLGKKKN